MKRFYSCFVKMQMYHNTFPFWMHYKIFHSRAYALNKMKEITVYKKVDMIWKIESGLTVNYFHPDKCEIFQIFKDGSICKIDSY